MPVRVLGLKAEHHREPFGIGESRPRLSWRIEATEPGWTQAAYEISVQPDDASPHVQSGRIDSVEQILVPWPAAPLSSRDRRLVRVRVWGDDEDPSPWSDPLVVETGLLRPDDWVAGMIAAEVPLPDRQDGPAILLRRAFELPAPPVLARLYVTAFGVYEIELSGQRVGDQVMAPGWTSYHDRLRGRLRRAPVHLPVPGAVKG